jgi:hypothetical protein
MTFVQRATSTLLLVLVAGGGVSCDVEAWLRRLSGEAPAERVAQLEPAATRPALRVKPEPADEEPLRAPEPPPSSRSSFNRIRSSTAPSKKPAARGSYAAPPAAMARSAPAPREIQPGSDACERARSGALRMQANVESIEREIERLEEVSDDIDYTPRTRERYEERVEAAEARLEHAEEAFGDYLQNERQRGIPLGCLR